MASAFTHAFATLAIGAVVKINFKDESATGIDWKFWIIGAICAALPDADSLGYALGVPYESMWGHRGITHSLFFSLLLAWLVCLFFYPNEKKYSLKWWGLLNFFFLCTASHAVLDAMTTGGLGVAFFAPFENTRYFFPFKPIKVSPISVTRFFSEKGLAVLKSEFVWVWIPTIAIFLFASSVKWLRK